MILFEDHLENVPAHKYNIKRKANMPLFYRSTQSVTQNSLYTLRTSERDLTDYIFKEAQAPLPILYLTLVQ